MGRASELIRAALGRQPVVDATGGGSGGQVRRQPGRWARQSLAAGVAVEMRLER